MKNLEGIWLDRQSSTTLQDQVARQIRELIRQGTLRPHHLLPSTRELAAQLRISWNTVVYAYDRLVSEGYAESRSRSGVFVSALLSLPQRGHEKNTPKYSKALDEEAAFLSRALRTPAPFRPCQPDVRLFPLSVWNQPAISEVD